MGNLFTNSQSSVYLGIEGAEFAVLFEHIEDFFGGMTGDALLSVKEGEFQRTVGDVIILYTSLVVFFDQIVDGLTAEDPIGGVDVALEDGGTEHDGGIALGVDGFFDAVQKHGLFGDISVDHLCLIAGGNACCQLFDRLDFSPGNGHLFDEVDFLLVCELLAGIFGEVEGRQDGV